MRLNWCLSIISGLGMSVSSCADFTAEQAEPLAVTTFSEDLPTVPQDDDKVLPPQDPSMGAIEIEAPQDPFVEQQIECPPDETHHVTEFQTNIFEVGLRWDLPGEWSQAPKAYTRYRCIPR